MKTFARLYWLSTMLALAHLPLSAALEWDQKEISLEVRRGSRDHVSAQFTFRNPGPKPVTITTLTTSCSCTEANPERSQIAAGEKSSLWILFTLGQRTGQQTKTITVTTDDPAAAAVTLTLKVNLLEPAAPTPDAT